VDADAGSRAVRTKVLPCYFPVGRGNPKRAVEILNIFKKFLS